MSRTLELPESLFAALEVAAKETGTTLVGWIASRLEAAPGGNPSRPQTLADRFEGRLGRVASGGKETLSEATCESFAAHLEERRRAGLL